MESIKTTIIIETDDPKKGYKFVEKMRKKGFTHESIEMQSVSKFPEARCKFELTKIERFK